MAKKYEATSEPGCPGEEECGTWQSSAEPKFCPSCPKRFVSGGESKGDAEVEFLRTIENLARERDSGFGLPHDLTEMEKELLMVWDDTVDQFERAHQQRVAEIFEALMTQRG